MIINGYDVTRRMPLFSGELRWAVRYGSKTQTRRLIKFNSMNPDGGGYKCPYGKVGDIAVMAEPLEAVRNPMWFDEENCEVYYSDDRFHRYTSGNSMRDAHILWIWNNMHLTSMQMPTYAGRTIVRYTEIHPEKLQSITDEDALAEGVQLTGITRCAGEARDAFAKLWDRLNPKTPWESDPWVWKIAWEKLQ